MLDKFQGGKLVAHNLRKGYEVDWIKLKNQKYKC